MYLYTYICTYVRRQLGINYTKIIETCINCRVYFSSLQKPYINPVYINNAELS